MTADRVVSLDEAISIAIRLQQSDQWVAAGDIYRKVLEVAPDHPDAMHYSGVLAHQEGRSEEALALIERSLELEPGRADWHSNLGIVLRDRLIQLELIPQDDRQIAVPVRPTGLELETSRDQLDGLLAPPFLMGEHS